jgi:4-diphosphocytidyl-2-C-methyl-D-erythritol kinase
VNIERQGTIVKLIASPGENTYFQGVMTTRAYAKINLGLRVLRKRDDSYHDIETVLHRIDLFDEILFEPSSTISLSCNRRDLPTDDTNLCVRAAVLLQQSLNIRNGVHITLKKNIPVGAGLGGGSSDAAAVLTALPVWWNKSPDTVDLHALASELGSDVPFFLKRGTARATGRGEILEYFDFDLPYSVVIVYPNIHISTTWAYQHVSSNPKPHTGSLKETLLDHISDPRILRSLLRNDFEPLVLRTHEEVAGVMKIMYDSGAVFTQISGSGSSVYGFFESEQSARVALGNFPPEYAVFTTSPHFTP